MKSNFEVEIENSLQRIKKKEQELKISTRKLNSDIKLFTNISWILAISGFVILIVSFFHYTFNKLGYNLLGDFLGGTVGSIWSLAGIFFIYVAFLGQRLQLINQQLELMYNQLDTKYTQRELNEQKIEFRIQNQTLQQQKFENTFFQLLGLFNTISESMDITNKDKIFTGRDCFKVFYEMLKSICIENHKKNPNEDNIISFKDLMNGYSEFYQKNISDLSHYFRTLYHIFKFIDQSDIEHKERYTSLVRSQLSSYEQILIFYNCLHINGLEKFKPLIEKYNVFKNIDVLLILNPKHKEKYNDIAFGKNHKQKKSRS